jgi:hypothetical protein
MVDDRFTDLVGSQTDYGFRDESHPADSLIGWAVGANPVNRLMLLQSQAFSSMRSAICHSGRSISCSHLLVDLVFAKSSQLQSITA